MPLTEKEISELQPYSLIKLFHKLILLHQNDKDYLIKLHKEAKILTDYLGEYGYSSENNNSLTNKETND
jgi:hypothetical protein